MVRRNFILVLGVWILFVEWSGFPYASKAWFFSCTGIILLCLGVLSLLRQTSLTLGKHAKETFVESRPDEVGKVKVNEV